MRIATFGAGLTGLAAAIAGAGWYAVAGLVLSAFATLGAACWVIADTARTRRTVALIAATRGTRTPPGTRTSRQRTPSERDAVAQPRRQSFIRAAFSTVQVRTVRDLTPEKNSGAPNSVLPLSCPTRGVIS